MYSPLPRCSLTFSTAWLSWSCAFSTAADCSRKKYSLALIKTAAGFLVIDGTLLCKYMSGLSASLDWWWYFQLCINRISRLLCCTFQSWCIISWYWLDGRSDCIEQNIRHSSCVQCSTLPQARSRRNICYLKRIVLLYLLKRIIHCITILRLNCTRFIQKLLRCLKLPSRNGRFKITPCVTSLDFDHQEHDPQIGMYVVSYTFHIPPLGLNRVFTGTNALRYCEGLLFGQHIPSRSACGSQSNARTLSDSASSGRMGLKPITTCGKKYINYMVHGLPGQKIPEQEDEK